MPGFSRDGVRLVISGHLRGSQDWSTSLWIDHGLGDPVPTQAQLTAYNTACETPVQSWITANINLWDSTTYADTLTSYFYPAGSTIATVQSPGATINVHGTATTGAPSQLAVVHSLRTLTAGRRGRGRVYFPMTSTSAIQSDGQLSDTLCSGMAGALVSLIRSLNAINLGSTTDGGAVSVASRAGGAYHAVSSVVVNSKIDTQRRREDKVAISHSETATV
jgi:hypothetical protein